MENKRKFKVSGKLIFNVLVFAVSIYFIVYFFVSEDGLIDLLKSPDGINIWWIIAGIRVYCSVLYEYHNGFYSNAYISSLAISAFQVF